MQINLSFDSTTLTQEQKNQTAVMLRSMADVLQGSTVLIPSEPTFNETNPKNKAPEKQQQEEKPKPKSKPKSRTKPKPKPKSEPVQESEPESDLDDFEDIPEKTYTVDQIRGVLRQYAKDNGKEEAIKILNNAGASSISDLDPDQYGTIMKTCGAA